MENKLDCQDLELRGVRMWMWLNTSTRHPCSHENVFNLDMAVAPETYT